MFLNDKCSNSGEESDSIRHFSTVYTHSDSTVTEYYNTLKNMMNLNKINNIGHSEVYEGIERNQLKFCLGPDGISSLHKSCI